MATSGLDQTIATSLIGGMVGQGSMPTFGGTTGKLKLMSSSTPASETGDTTEISGGSYPTGGISFTLSTMWGSPAYASNAVTVANSGTGGAVTQTGMPAVSSPGINYASVWDTAGTPKRWWWGALTTAIITNSGDTVTFAQTTGIVMTVNM